MNERLNSLLDEKGAVQLSHTVNSVLGMETLVRVWPLFSREYTNEAVAALRAKGWIANGKLLNEAASSNVVVDPLVNTRPRSGTWIATEVVSGLERHDPMNPQSELVWSITQTLVKGQTAEPVYISEDGCEFVVQSTPFMGMSALPVLPDKVPGILWRVTGAGWSEQYKGWNFTLEQRTRLYRNHTDRQESRHDQHTTRQQQLGVTDQTVASIESVNAGKVVRRQIDYLEDCARNVVTDETEAQNQEAKTGEADYFGHRVTDINTQATEAVTHPTGPTDGTAMRVVNRPTPFGRFATEETTETPSADRTLEYAYPRGLDPSGTHYWGENASALPAGLLNSDATVSLSVRRNRFGLLSYTANRAPVPPNVVQRFTNYQEEISLPNMQERTTSRGQVWVRTYTNCKLRIAGNKVAANVSSYISACNYQVSFNANGSGTYFQGRGIIRDSPGDWTKEADLGDED